MLVNNLIAPIREIVIFSIKLLSERSDKLREPGVCMTKLNKSFLIGFVLLIPLIFVFQNCSKVKFNPVNTIQMASLATPLVCQSAGQVVACRGANGEGVAICAKADDSSVGACQIQSCDSGYYLENGVCLQNKCIPSSVSPCMDGVGSGTKSCAMNGSGFSSCQINACNAGYNLQKGVCVANVCEPNGPSVCKEANGTGTKLCNSSGTGYGSCTIASCDSGYNLQNGKCVQNVCNPNSVATCADATGIGTGTKTCNAQGVGYGACQVNACAAGYNLQNGVCVMNACNPNASSVCKSGNGTGTQMCNAVGSGYNACALSSCDAGFNLQNGKCVANVCSPSTISPCVDSTGIGSGTKTCMASGAGFGSCQIAKCSDGYNLQNGVCVANICKPGVASACSERNGSGDHTCNATGTGYGACTLKSCDATYNLQNGSCVPNVCKPNEAVACTDGTGIGSGTKSCMTSGAGFGSCQITSCSGGYDVVNGTCVAQAPQPAPTPVEEGCENPANPGGAKVKEGWSITLYESLSTWSPNKCKSEARQCINGQLYPAGSYKYVSCSEYGMWKELVSNFRICRDSAETTPTLTEYINRPGNNGNTSCFAGSVYVHYGNVIGPAYGQKNDAGDVCKGYYTATYTWYDCK